MDSLERSRVVGRFRKLSNRDKAFVSNLKSRETWAEGKLWDLIRDCQLDGLKFRRQHKVGQFVLDFFCIPYLLAIEVDGGIHKYRVKEDAVRTAWLENFGIKVIRFSNEEVLNSPESVLKEIRQALSSTVSP